MSPLRLRVIACPSLRPELEALAAQVENEIAFHHLDMGLHQRSAEALRAALQSAIDQSPDCDAIAIGYGLCNRGVIGIRARSVPLVLPRAHDCVSLLLGSAARHREELDRQPGTYFQSAGWLKAARDERHVEFAFGPNAEAGFERLAARYGREAALYLQEQFESFTRHYRRLAYIATPVTTNPVDEAQARAIAEAKHWAYQRLEGDTGWLKRLLQGIWMPKEFLMVPPGACVLQTCDDTLFASSAEFAALEGDKEQAA